MQATSVDSKTRHRCRSLHINPVYQEKCKFEGVAELVLCTQTDLIRCCLSCVLSGAKGCIRAAV